MKRHLISLLAAASFFLALPASADPVGWRTDWTGQYPKADPPLSWGQDRNVVWKVPTGKWSNATVVPYKDLLFYNEETATLVCASKENGQEIWRATTTYGDLLPTESAEAARKQQEEIAALKQQEQELLQEDRRLNAELRNDPRNQALRQQLNRVRQQRNNLRRNLQVRSRNTASRPPATHGTNGYSSATPLVAGKQVYVLYGSGAAAAYDLKGNRQWARIVGRPTNGWGHSASPVLVDKVLILHLANTVYGLDPRSGETLWTAASGQFWGTPFPFRLGRSDWAVLTTGGVIIRAADGRVLAEGIGAMPWSSPVAKNGVLYIMDEKGAFAYRIPDGVEDPAGFEKLWSVPITRDRYYSSPLIHDGLIYNVTQRGHMTVLDIRDGATVYKRAFPLGGTFFPSITLAGDHLFVSSDTGKTVVFLPGPEYREVGMNQLDAFRSNLVFEKDRIYVRTLRNLYCLGSSP